MTQQEMESELIRLRELETARRANWRPIKIAATFCALMFAVAGVGLSWLRSRCRTLSTRRCKWG